MSESLLEIFNMLHREVIYFWEYYKAYFFLGAALILFFVWRQIRASR